MLLTPVRILDLPLDYASSARPPSDRQIPQKVTQFFCQQLKLFDAFLRQHKARLNTNGR